MLSLIKNFKKICCVGNHKYLIKLYSINEINKKNEEISYVGHLR